LRKLVCIISLCLGFAASGAFAADVSIRGNISETLQASDNFFLQNAPLGTTLQSLTAVNLDILARTPGWRYLLSSNVSYYNYSGDGADQQNPKSGTPINETFRVEHTTDLAKYFFAANYTRADVATTQLAQTGFVNSTGTINTFRALGGATHDINRIDSITWTAAATRTTFTDDPGQTDFSDLNGSVAWARMIDPNTTWTNSVSLDWLDADDIGKSQRLFWQLMTSVRSQLTRRLNVSATFGYAFSNAWHAATVPPGTTSTFIQTGAANSMTASASMSYLLLKNTTVTLTAAHLIVPTGFGQLQKITSAGFTLNQGINYWSSIDLSANYAHTDGNTFSTGSTDFFSAQLAYNYRFARDWRSRFSYTYRQRDDSTGTARANVFLVSLAYDFNLMGNPSAFDPVDAERALLRQQRAIGEVFPMLH
jgi:hypothetical protein